MKMERKKGNKEGALHYRLVAEKHDTKSGKRGFCCLFLFFFLSSRVSLFTSQTMQAPSSLLVSLFLFLSLSFLPSPPLLSLLRHLLLLIFIFSCWYFSDSPSFSGY